MLSAEEVAKVVSEVTGRIIDDISASVSAPGTGAKTLAEVINETLWWEQERLRKQDPSDEETIVDKQFYAEIRRQLPRVSEAEQLRLLERVVHRYANEIAGNFSPTFYKLAAKVAPPMLSALLTGLSPKRLLDREAIPRLDQHVIIEGEVANLGRLRERGTLIVTPTHSSNLDSIVIGFAIHELGLPPLTYGAGLNLFRNPIVGKFMHNLGAYTVDRKKQDPLYKQTLKEYCALTLEHGFDNLFFPGGTRSRSGAVESYLKRGLLGCSLSAYIHNLQQGNARPKIFVVPCTLSMQLVLEAETLIDDFLKEVGKSRYIIDDDEFSQPKRVFDFVSQLSNLDSKIHVTVSRGLDVFGNAVDDDGNSLDPGGRTIDERRYVLDGDTPARVADRDAEYTTELAGGIAQAFLRDNVVESTHITARAIFRALRRRNPDMSTLRLIRTGGQEDDLPLREVYRETEQLLETLRDKAQRSQIRLGPSTRGPAEDVVSDGLLHFDIYHTRPAARRRGDRVVPSDRTLLLYYQNRLEGYHLEGGDLLTSDRRALR